MAVFVLDRQGKPLMPCKEKRATKLLKGTGRGSYPRTRLNAYGFPRGFLMKQKRVEGFGTGDLAVARVPKGLKAGLHKGRVAVRAAGSFNTQTGTAVVQGVSPKHCRLAQRADGYGYFQLQSITSKDAGEGRVNSTARSASPA